MYRNINALCEEYGRRFHTDGKRTAGTLDTLTVQEYSDIINEAMTGQKSELDGIYRAVDIALKVGFALGYRKAKTDLKERG